ncbi:PEP-CTERM sorting domain-containing protein [Paucibacter sp. R3-3]|uniref:PEP-CTERM sorting domain-containing protein n=1 Tax=Roseateles agri TaxID=3098619 RepID=A0ABU5DRX7_9BURK|nr:PEP-CTERM sorting domain-containing protein [Paucibacter sp. R3-3]MDY0749074.1 PEP-CTERM sorting domain-containing protein [Paucibacter sp. R3-3]
MPLPFSNFTIGLALAFASSLALATSTGAGAVTAVSYTLIDLDPNDGVAPSISFAASTSAYAGPYVYGYVRAATAEEDTYREFTHVGATPSGNVSGSVTTDVSSASSSATGATGIGFSALAVSGSAMSGIDFSGVYYATTNAPTALFTLSANTEVIFTVTGWLTGKTTQGGDPDIGNVENGGAVLQLETSGPTSTGSTAFDRESAAAVAWYSIGADGSASGESQSWQGQLVSSYSNSSTLEADGRFTAVLSVGGTSIPVAAVPEPASGALILTGLAAVGGAVRRRRLL